MAADIVKAYEKGLLKVALGTLDFINDTLIFGLLDAAHTPDLVNHEFISDIVAQECADGDYVRQTASGKALTIVSGKLRFDSADVDFGNAVTISAKYLFMAKNTGSDATSPLLFLCDLNQGGGNLSSTAGDFDPSVNANGLYEITINA